MGGDTVKRRAEKMNFKPFGQATKAARERNLTRRELAAQIRISPRYVASIENSGQTPQPASFLSPRHLLGYVCRSFFLPCSPFFWQSQLSVVARDRGSGFQKNLPQLFVCEITSTLLLFFAVLILRH